MFSVLDVSFDNNVVCEKVVLRSFRESDCWQLVQNRLTHSDARVRENAHNLVVVDMAGNYCDAPDYVLSLYNRKELVC